MSLQGSPGQGQVVPRVPLRVAGARAGVGFTIRPGPCDAAVIREMHDTGRARARAGVAFSAAARAAAGFPKAHGSWRRAHGALVLQGCSKRLESLGARRLVFDQPTNRRRAPRRAFESAGVVHAGALDEDSTCTHSRPPLATRKPNAHQSASLFDQTQMCVRDGCREARCAALGSRAERPIEAPG